MAFTLQQAVPFLSKKWVENKDGIYSRKDDCASYVLKNGMLTTGQNPASSEAAAKQ